MNSISNPPLDFYQQDWAICEGCMCRPRGRGACMAFKTQHGFEVGISREGKYGCGKKIKE